MSIRQLAREMQEFIKESHTYHEEYKKQEEHYMDNYHKGILGDKGLSQKIAEIRDEINSKQLNKSERLKAKIDQVHANELKHIEKTTEGVTADEVAELQLISQLELTDEEMNEYIKKYRRSPLALKKLQAIAKDNKNIHLNFPRDRKKYLNVVLGRWRSQINRWEYMPFDELSVKIEMYMEAAIDGIDEDLRSYESL